MTLYVTGWASMQNLIGQLQIGYLKQLHYVFTEHVKTEILNNTLVVCSRQQDELKFREL